MTIIEDEQTRTEELRIRLQKRLKFLIDIEAPQEVIDHVQNVEMNITYTEHRNAEKQIEKALRQEKIEYAKNHPLEKSIVDEIYARMEKLPCNTSIMISPLNFHIEIDAVSIMGVEHYDNDLYDDILNHAYELYCERYRG
jgi:hypothetical protein